MKKIIFLFVICCLVLCNYQQSFAHSTADANLQGLWYFDNDATDSDPSGNNDLTAVGSPTYSSADKQQGTHSAVLVQSSSQYFTIADGSQTGLGVTGSFSCGGWVQFDVVDSADMIVSKHGDGDYGYVLHRYSDNAEFSISSNGSAWSSCQTGATEIGSESTWYHVVGVYDGSYQRIYVNGSEITANDPPCSYSAGVNDTAAPFEVGTDDFNNQYLDGHVDEIFFFNDALTSTEVSDIHTNGITAPSSSGAQIIIISWLKAEGYKLKRAWKYGFFWSYLTQKVF